ncbi:MAG: outer membrane beta-barrel protein [Myxococcales bacterium]|nr:outer membrane beta-barrel protein [Myxococcales bacterium]
MRTKVLALTFASLLALPAAAQAAEGGLGVGGLEFLMGFGGSSEFDFDNGSKAEQDMSITWGIVPWIEQALGRSVGIGAEMMFLWVTPDKGDHDRQLVMSPHARVRMSFPIINKVTFDGMLGVGGTIWTEDDAGNDTRFGWSLRFGFGGSYAINDVVSAYGMLGYYRSTTYGDDITATLDMVPLSLGLRGNF